MYICLVHSEKLGALGDSFPCLNDTASSGLSLCCRTQAVENRLMKIRVMAEECMFGTNVGGKQITLMPEHISV